MASGAPGIHGPDVEPFDLKKHELKKPGDLPHIYAIARWSDRGGETQETSPFGKGKIGRQSKSSIAFFFP